MRPFREGELTWDEDGNLYWPDDSPTDNETDKQDDGPHRSECVVQQQVSGGARPRRAQHASVNESTPANSYAASDLLPSVREQSPVSLHRSADFQPPDDRHPHGHSHIP